MHPRVREFLRARDRATLRGDLGMIRAMTVELRRLGVSDEATLADPSGKHAKPAQEPPKEKRRAKARCEHGRDPERCEDCTAAELAEARA